jgi:hypothetical protein
MGHQLRIGIAVALLFGVAGMYFILGGCETSKNRSCVGALLALTAGVPGDFSEECRNGPCPKREEWLAQVNGPNGWSKRRKCPKGGTYSIEIKDKGELDDWKSYRVVCTAHGDLEKAKVLIDKSTYDQLRSLLPVAYRPD